MAQQIFTGLRVIELGSGMATALAGMILADNGAEVIKIEPPSGDWTREKPAFLMWNRGKKSVVIDQNIMAGRDQAAALIRSADVLIEAVSSSDSGHHGFDPASLSERNPGLVHCSISGFGLVAGYEYCDPSEAIVTAKSGRCNGNDKLAGAHFDNRPIYIAAPINECGAAFLAVQGVCAALTARLRTGRGQRVETSLLDGTSAATMRLAFERSGDAIVPVARRGTGATLTTRCIRMTFMTAECADGRFIQMCARQPAHFRNWMNALGLAHLMDEDERFRLAPLGIKTVEDVLELETIIRERMRGKTMAEWMHLFSHEWDVGADPFLTPQEFLEHPQMVLNGRVVLLNDPDHGAVKQVGPLVLFDRTPSKIEETAPRLGADQTLLTTLADKPAMVSLPTSPSELPLTGITILELAYFLAAPLAATTLAEMGARVIKIEPVTGDPFRSSGLEFVHIVNGKESIAVDLKSKAGQQIFARIVRECDALLHNFRPGAPERLGVDYESVRRIKPDIVYLYGASYGSKGPERLRPAFHSTPNALSGGGILQAGAGNTPVDDSYPDPIAGLGAGVALALGIYHHARTGEGQYMETTMLTSSGYIHSERLTFHENADRPPEVDAQQLGLGALHRFYACAAGWLFISAVRPGEWERLATALEHPEWLTDSRFATRDARKRNDTTLAAELECIIVNATAKVWEQRLIAAKIPAAETGSSLEEFLAENNFLEDGHHPAFGAYWRLKPRVRFSRGRHMVRQPSAIGEHTIKLLQEFGFNDVEIARSLKEGSVVAAETRNLAAVAR